MSAIDVDEILEHQLNANMLSMPYDVYSELFDSIAALGDENAKLRKENAELRVDVDLMNCQLRARAEERNDLQVENAKLRKLVALQREFSDTICGPECKRLDEYCGLRVDEECHYEHEIYDRMRELGIEAVGA